MIDQDRLHPAAWRPQVRLAARIASLRQLQAFNDTGGIAVNFDVLRGTAPDIAIVGSQNSSLSLWETRSASGFVTKPKFHAGLLTIRFVTRGRITYRAPVGDVIGSPTHATLVGFEDLNEVEASDGFSAISVTIAIDALLAAHVALTGRDWEGLPSLAPLAEIASPGMQALYCTIRQIQQRIHDLDRQADFVLPLIQEVLCYQLLSAWPGRVDMPASARRDVPSRSLQAALDYIAANLSGPLTLADIAGAAGISVRSLQDQFRRDIGQTPVQFLIDQRLMRAHQDLRSAHGADLPVAEIARRWGFVHMGDFGQRYRRRYGCTPSETRLTARRGR